MKGCLQGSQKLKEWLIDSLKNVKPPQIIPEKVTEYSLELVFDKHYSQNLQTKHPELHLGKFCQYKKFLTNSVHSIIQYTYLLTETGLKRACRIVLWYSVAKFFLA